VSLKDASTYVYLSFLTAGLLAAAWGWTRMEIWSARDGKQWNEPEIRSDTWRLARHPNMGVTLEAGMFAVFRRFGAEQPCVARIIATEGQRVEVQEKAVLVDGSPVTYGTKNTSTSIVTPELTVPRGCIFLLCDDYGKSGSFEQDSRRFGPIPVEAVTHCFRPLDKKAGRP
jgi:type IV secretory pathway protease TraF